MKQNNIIIAPQCSSTTELYEVWKDEHFGTEVQFFEFMTTPSRERTAFLEAHSVELSHDGSFITQNYSV